MESKIRHLLDASLVLEPTGSAAIAAASTVAATNKVDINKITKSYAGALNGRYGEGSFAVVVYVIAATKGVGDETFTLNFKTYDANGANGALQQAVAVPQAAIGQPMVFEFDTATLAVNDPTNGNLFGVEAVVAGTTPTFQYWAFVAPINRN